MAEADSGRYGRAPWLRPDDLDADQRAVYDAINGGPRASGTRLFAGADEEGRLYGPFNPMLFAPRVGDPLQALGAAIRYQSSLSHRAREIAILEVARERQSEFEWYAHARVGAAIGLTEAELDALLAGGELELPPDEALVRRVAIALLRSRDLDNDLFAEAEGVLGFVALSELITLVGYYDLLALSMRVWRTPLPPDVPAVF